MEGGGPRMEKNNGILGYSSYSSSSSRRCYKLYKEKVTSIYLYITTEKHLLKLLNRCFSQKLHLD